MGKAIVTILTLALLVLVGFFIFDRDDDALITEGNGAATSTDLTGTGGADDDFDPLLNPNENEEYNDKG
jgi:hypothetical protein